MPRHPSDPEPQKPAGAPDGRASGFAALSALARHFGLDDRAVADTGAEEPSIDAMLAAAKGAGMRGRHVRMTWQDLAKLDGSFPVILRMHDGRCLLLWEMQPHAKVPVALVGDPLVGDPAPLPIDELRLTRHWKGDVILVRAAAAVERETGSFGPRLITRLLAADRRIALDVLIAAGMTSLFALIPPLLYMIVVDRVLVHQRASTLVTLVVAITFVLAFDTAFGWLRRHLLAIGTARLDARLGLLVFDRLLDLPVSFFERTPSGEIVHKLGELRRIRHFFTGQLLGTILDGATVLVLVPAMFLLHPLLAAYVVGVAVLMMAVVAIYVGPMHAAYARVVKTEQRKNALLVESIHGMRTIKSLALERHKRAEWDRSVADSVEATTALQKLANQPQTILAPLEKSIYAGSLALGAWLVIEHAASMNAGTLVAFTMIATRVAQPLVQFAGLMQQVQEIRGAFRQVASVVDLPSEKQRRTGSRPSIEGAIDLVELGYRYPGAAVPALDRIDVSIERGSLVGIMGRSGSGKSTLIALLQGLRSGYQGLIRIDGTELREIDLAHLRRHLGVVSQDSFLFRGTIRENILAGRNEPAPGRLLRAARLAGADEFIERLPQGFDTPLDEGSTNLSGGQRQRIAIARALFGEPPILILDEATSALDPDSEAVVNAGLRAIARGRTVLVVSHRLSSLVDCDQILVLDRGRLVGSGRHADLLTRCEPYRHLWHQQIRRDSAAASFEGPADAALALV